MKLKVTNPKYMQLKKACSYKELACHANVKEIIKINNELYIITTIIKERVFGYRIMNLDNYQGKFIPITYQEHLTEVRFNKRKKHSFSGIKFKSKNNNFLIIGNRIEFQDSKIEKQSTIF